MFEIGGESIFSLLIVLPVAGILATAIAAYLYFEVRALSVREYVVPIEGLPSAFDGFTILHLSDLHAKEFGREQQRLIELINRYQFDMVALTGDFIDQHNRSVEPAVKLARDLVSKPIFFVSGNHERWVKGNVDQALADVGVEILDNREAKIERDVAALHIFGISAARSFKRWLQGESSLAQSSLPKILLSHSPNIFSSAVDAHIDLTLVGHTHGGQIRLPFVGVLYAPGQGLFPKYDYGLFSSGQSTMIVNGGLGESSMSIRVARRPEIVLVKLVPAR